MFIRRNSTLKKTQGFSLIELLIALTISLLILIITTTIFLAVQNNLCLQNEMSYLQENIRLATQLLTSDIRMAGYIGCPKLTDGFPIKQFQSVELNPRNKITATNNSVTVRHASVMHANLTQPIYNHSEIFLTPEPRFKAGDILLITDCKNAEIFQVNKVLIKDKEQKLLTTKPLAMEYEKYAEVSLLEINNYFIDKTDRQSVTGQTIYALYKRNIKGRKTELIENINSMHVNLSNNGVGVEIILSFLTSQAKKLGYIYIALRD